MSMAVAVIGMLIVFVGLGLASIATWRRTADRARKLERLAAANGFAFSHDDLSGLTALPFQLFEEGDGRHAHNVLTGTAPDGAPARVFDFTYYVETKEREGGWLRPEDGLRLEARSSRRYYRFSCCVTELPVAWPHLIIEPERLGRRLLNKLGLPDVEVESEAFNRHYAVTGDDRRFAELLLDPRLIDLVIGTDRKFRFEIRGRWLLSATERIPAHLALPMVNLNTEFRRRVPALVLEEYPEIAPAGTLGGWVGPEPGADGSRAATGTDRERSP
jgi:hypothetical protein